ncbi:MAG: hypothetical protein GQ557_02700 [Mycoplasmataceae bacterium]|nr:hypothetical protein [Mycoplasmataceae bacterium]
MKINNKKEKIETTFVGSFHLENFLSIKNNEDWKKIPKNNEMIVNINNSNYFGFRAQEKKVKAIRYSAVEIDSLKRILKESKKFNSTHFIVFDIDEFDPKAKKMYKDKNEWFCKETAKLISEIEEIKADNLVIEIVQRKGINLSLIIDVIATIYKFKIAIRTDEIYCNDAINFIIKKQHHVV